MSHVHMSRVGRADMTSPQFVFGAPTETVSIPRDDSRIGLAKV